MHQLNGRARRVSHDLLGALERAHLLRLVGHVLHEDSGEAGAVAVLFGTVDECGAAAPGVVSRHAIGGGDGRVKGSCWAMVQLS